MKKITSFILLIATVISTFAFTSCYIQTFRGKKVEYALNDDGVSYTLGYMYLSEECEVVIPSEYNGLPVTKIAYTVFWNQHLLKSLTIPATVTSIADYAFSGCSNLERVTFEEGSRLKEIGTCAFVDCSSLKEIELPESLEYLGQYAFEGCGSLESIHIPKGVSEFSGTCFEGCTSLKSITLDEENETYTMEGNFICKMEDGKKRMVLCLGGDDDGILRFPEDIFIYKYGQGGREFLTCKNVDTVYIPSSLDVVPQVECAKEYIVAEDNPYFCSVDGVVYSKDMTELVYYPPSKEDKTFTVPSSVKRILGYGYNPSAFGNVKYLENVIISEGVTHIEGWAFVGSNIKSVELPKSIEQIGSKAFYNCNSLEEIRYAGTKSEFRKIRRDVDWVHYTKSPILGVVCANGKRYIWTGIK